MFLNISFKTYFQNRIMECKIGMKVSVENVYFIQNSNTTQEIWTRYTFSET